MVQVIYVEDDALTGKICQHLFSLVPDTQLTVFTSGYDALEHLKNTSYDIILLDVGLNDISGLEVASFIRNKLNLSSPIIATSAHIDNSTESPWIDEFIEKPLTLARIKKMLKEHSRSNG